MTSRERVRAAIHHREPDKVPIDFGGTRVTGIHADCYTELGNYLGLDAELPRVWDQFQFLARVEENMRRRFQGDVIHLENPCEYFELINSDWKVWKTSRGNNVLVPGEFNPVEDERGYLHLMGLTEKTREKTLGLMPKGGMYFERFNDPADVRDYDDPMSPEEWASHIVPYTDEELKQLQTTAKWMHDYTDYAVCGGFNKLKMTSATIFAGHTIQDWLVRMMMEPEYVCEILDAATDQVIVCLKTYLEAVGPYIDTIFMSTTDYGTQDRELFNPDIFYEIFVPRIKKVNDYVHGHCDAKTIQHTDGCIRHIMDGLIEAGMDIINPIQTSAAGMNPAEIKKEFGDRVVIWGCGMDIQNFLPNATVAEVRQYVTDRMALMKPGGGFVFSPEHNLQCGVSCEKITAMFDAAIENRNY